MWQELSKQAMKLLAATSLSDRRTGLTNHEIEFNLLLPTGLNLYLQLNLGSSVGHL
jgi:hypothetical protein